FGLAVFLFALVGGTAQEVDVLFVFGLAGKLLGFVESFLGVAPALQARVHNGQPEVDIAIFGRALEHGPHVGERLLGVAGVGELSIEHHAQFAIIGHFLHRFPGGGGGLRPQFRFAVGIDDVLISGASVVVAEGNHPAKSVDGSLIVPLVAVHHSQALDKDGAIVAVGLRVTVFGLLSFLQQILQELHRLVVATLSLVNHRDVIGNLKCIGDHSLGFFQAIQSLVVLALAAVDLGNTEVSLGIFVIGVCDNFVLIE